MKNKKTLINSEDIILREISQAQDEKHHMASRSYTPGQYIAVPKDFMEMMELVIAEILVKVHQVSYTRGVSSKDALLVQHGERS